MVAALVGCYLGAVLDPPSEAPLKDGCYVVRFGIMALNDVKRSIESSIVLGEGARLSFFGENGASPAEIADIGGAPNGQMRVCRIGVLFGGGFEIERDEPPPGHLAVKWEETPSDEELKRLIGLFDEPIENPHPMP